MTENPTQGASPDPSPSNRDPLEPGHGAGAAPQAEAGEDSAGENPTMRLDRPAYDAPRPVYPQSQPAYGQHAAPATQQFDAPSAQSHGQPVQNHAAAPNTGQYAQSHGPYAGYGSQPPAPQNNGGYNQPGNAPKRRAAFGVPTLVASILAAGLVGGGVVAGGNALIGNRPLTSTSSTGHADTVIVNNQDSVNAITAAAVKASPSVVTIKATSGSDGGTGSGIILDGDGHVLTNTHVVTLDGKTSKAALEVRTSDGRVFSATVVGTDPVSDLAVIKINNPAGLIAATLGDSDKLNVGDTAIAIGSPLGLTGTVTDGIVSTLNRTISVASSAAPKDGSDNSQGGGQGFQFAPPGGGQAPSTANQGSISINVIQTDAAINPGNSGGALVNSKGEVIGVNVAIASAGGDSSGSSSSGNIGVGFSIPINNAKRVAQEIITNGKATHGQFGVSVKSKAAGTSFSGFSVGADVATVESGSAADKAGIKVGDVITKFQNLTISDPNQLTAAVREQAAGATVKVTVLRGGQAKELDVTLGAAAVQ
ncbi:trypsin-like peptidase domain-containing protein [Arthrobacter sp. UYEF3]|uniref:trypsin-like peptidase domain-containing protein n=1 Tax=Arthrobacter sp. UYEF3 TaxID=1756365 RepID=UPI00339167E6